MERKQNLLLTCSQSKTSHLTGQNTKFFLCPLRQMWSDPWLRVQLHLPPLSRYLLCSGHTGILAVSQKCWTLSYDRYLHVLFPLPRVFHTQICTSLTSSPTFLPKHCLRTPSRTIPYIIAILLCIFHAVFSS